MFDMTILIDRNVKLKISKAKSLKGITTKHKIGVVHVEELIIKTYIQHKHSI